MSIKNMNIGRIEENTAAVPARFRPCLKVTWLAGREGDKPAAAFYPERKAAVGRWVTIRRIYFKNMNIGRIKENTAAVPARFRPSLKPPVLVGGIHVVASFYAVSRPAVGCWVPNRGMNINKIKIGRIKENTEAVPARFRPSLEVAGLTIGNGKKSYWAIVWKAGAVPGVCTGRIGLCIRSSIGCIM